MSKEQPQEGVGGEVRNPTYSDPLIVNGWTLYRWEGHRQVEIGSPDGEQECQLDEDGLLVLVSDSERGRSYSGDCAGSRFIPLDVLRAALRVYDLPVVTP